MTNEELNTRLYEKMAAEQTRYRNWLLTLPPAEILRHAYEYSVREDIVMCMEELELPDKQAKALLRSKSPVDKGYMIGWFATTCPFPILGKFISDFRYFYYTLHIRCSFRLYTISQELASRSHLTSSVLMLTER